MKGYSDIPALHHTALRSIVSAYVPRVPSMMFSQYFAPINIPTDETTWEIELGSEGISPFVAPGAPAPMVGIDGMTSARAKVAYWKEKAYFDESLLNNLRKPGTMEAMDGTRKIGTQLKKLIYRSMRRKEWMCSQALINGELNYVGDSGRARFSVKYGRPAANTVILSEDRKWGTGTKKNPVEDLYEARSFMSDTYGIQVSQVVLNSATQKLLLFDADIQSLLKSSAFGDGQLFSNPTRVLGELFGVGSWAVNDDMYAVPAWVHGVNGNVITVDNATDFVVGGKLYLESATERFATEHREITAVNAINSTVTVKTAFTNTPVAGRDKVFMNRKFVEDGKVLLHTPFWQGSPTGQFHQAPFGIPAHYGLFTDTDTEWDPAGMYIRVQDKGLPIVYAPQTTYTLVVK